jgi:protein Mpv17
MQLARNTWVAYERILHRFPVRTQAVTTGILWTLGDALAQKKVEGKAVMDKRRLVATAAYATAVVGPIGHGWYTGLDWFARKHFAPRTFAFVAAKVALDEIVFTPVHIAAFFTFLTAVEGGSWEDIKAKLRQDYISTLLTEMVIWPGFQALNFWKVPLKHQLLLANSATVADSTFLCWARSQDNWLAAIWPSPGTAEDKKDVVKTEAGNV